jgi:hypothetical protein
MLRVNGHGIQMQFILLYAGGSQVIPEIADLTYIRCGKKPDDAGMVSQFSL